MREIIQVELEDIIERRVNCFLSHLRSSRDLSLVSINGCNDSVRITLVVFSRQILTRFQLNLNALVLVVGVGIRNAKKARRLLMLMIHVVVADD